MTDIFRIFLDCINVFFLLYLLGYSTFLFLSVVVGATRLYRDKEYELLQNKLWQNYYVPVSILVPAYNEEVTVVETVRSLLSLDYKLYEIIVMDDGSKDDTTRVLVEAFGMTRVERPIRRQLPCQPVEAVYETDREKVPITLVRKRNGGKADSLNMGINCARYPYFICMDADSVLQYDSLERIVRPVLEHRDVVAVGGSVRPANGVVIQDGRVVQYRLPKNLLACMQALEYDRSFLAARILLDRFNGNLIISGAFGLFEKRTVIAAGGYDASTMGEDMELVVRLHEFCRANHRPYQIKYAPDAVCWSQAPERLRDLGKQRKRWQRGLFQSMWGHREIGANPRYGAVGLFSYLYFLLYELLSPYIEVFGVLTILLSVAMDMLNIRYMVLYFVLYALYGALLSLTAFFSRIHTIDMKLRFGDLCKAVLLCLFEITFVRFYLAVVRALAFVGYKKNKLNWDKLERQKLNQDAADPAAKQ